MIIQRSVFVLSVLLTCFVAMGQHRLPVLDPNAKPMERITEIKREVGIDQKLDQQVPLDLKFRDEAGREVQLRDYVKDKPVVLSLVYYGCPMLCGQVLSGMLKSFKNVDWTAGKEFEVLTVSFDPTEKPELAAEKKATYLKQYDREGAEKGWHWLTGDQDQIKQLTDAVGFRYTYDEKLQQYAHASGIMVLTPDGKISRYLYGISYPARDVRLALTEAGNGQVGGPVEMIMLLCYHYDPTLGKYSLLTLNLIKIGGILTLLSLGTFIVVMLRRDARLARLAKVGQAG